VGFGLGGVGYALGNLLLARALPPAQFGVFTLFVALVQIGASLAPVGLDGQVNRRPGGVVLPGRVLLPSGIVAAAAAIFASTLYRLDTALVVALVISVTAGGATHVAAAIFQSRLRFGLSLSLSQGLAVALLGRERPRGPTAAHPFSEGLSLLGITAAALILMQLERLLTPRLLTLEDLATFAVVASIVGSRFACCRWAPGIPCSRASVRPRLKRIAGSWFAARQWPSW
jgi:hypothetical protein